MNRRGASFWLFACGLVAIACSVWTPSQPAPRPGTTTVLPPAGPPGSAAPPPPASPSGAAACPPRPLCDAPLPALGSARPFRHTRSKLAAAAGSARHRGRDLFLRPGQPQWVIGKFAYGLPDDDLEDEDIDVYLLRGCGSTWEKVGTYRTSNRDGQNPTVEGVEDTEGRIYVNLASVTRPLGIGRHRVRMVVTGDLTGADLYLEVLPQNAKIAVSDIDGTLTTSETALTSDIVGAEPPGANPGAASVMNVLAGRGYYLFYLTARPDWLTGKTREWLALRGFPPGILHTTLTGTGATGKAAAAFKSAELAALAASTGIVPDVAFGNKASDVTTYTAARIAPGNSYYFKLDADLQGGVAHDDYRKLAAGFTGLPQQCR